MDSFPIQLALAGIAFGFALLLANQVRHLERFDREPWGQVLFAFAVGAFVTVAGGVGLSLLLLTPLRNFGDCVPFDLSANSIFAAVFVAPFAEELMKAMGVIAVGAWIREVEDGIVYGAAVGLGFAAMENLFYFTDALLTEGLIGVTATVLLRSLTSTLLHLSATGLTGFGLGLHFASRETTLPWPLFLLLSMLVHAVFNLTASLQLLAIDLSGRIVLAITGFSLGAFITWSLFLWLRRLVQDLDRIHPAAESR